MTTKKSSVQPKKDSPAKAQTTAAPEATTESKAQDSPEEDIPAGETGENKAKKSTTDAAKPKPGIEKTGDSLRKKLEVYFHSNPGVNEFYVTSDGQPFYEKQWAREHQKSIDPTKEVSTVTR